MTWYRNFEEWTPHPGNISRFHGSRESGRYSIESPFLRQLIAFHSSPRKTPDMGFESTYEKTLENASGCRCRPRLSKTGSTGTGNNSKT